jgi:arylsulfatase A-like enzyme
LGALIDELRAGPLAQSTLVVFLSARGFPLGEHLRVGPVDDALYNEQVQIAWMMRLPDSLGAAARSQALVIPADLPATLGAWLGWPADSFAAASQSLMPLVEWQARRVRECVVLRSGAHDWAVRTPAWHFLAHGAGDERRTLLYSKPSDRFEVNDVADRVPDVAAGLEAVLAQAQAAPTETPASFDPLLTEELD